MKKSIIIIVAMFVMLFSTNASAGMLDTIKETASSCYDTSVSAVKKGASVVVDGYNKSIETIKDVYSDTMEYTEELVCKEEVEDNDASNPQEYYYNEDEEPFVIPEADESKKLKTYLI